MNYGFLMSVCLYDSMVILISWHVALSECAAAGINARFRNIA